METRELESPPSLTPLYAKAVLGPAVPGGGDELPDHALELSAVEIDAERLADYCAVCGFRLRDTLPPTYPHLLGFPLSMALMTERAFPFSLLGMVHIGNRIEQRRPVSVTARPAVRVWTENLRSHHKGRQLDLMTEVSVEGEVAWLERSNYLRPGKGSGEPSAREEDRFADARPVATWAVPGDVGRRYAAVSGDRNPIHMHPLTARLFGFPTAIAHGMWSYARALATLDGHLPDAHTSEVEFRAPLRIPGTARLLLDRDEGEWRLVLESPDGEHRHLQLTAQVQRF
jgi:acyl dehydratase